MTRIFGILLAAGAGIRLGAGVPKAFVSIDGKTILERSYSTLLEAECLSGLVVTVPGELVTDPVCHLIQRSGFRVIVGGIDRQQSVSLALDCLSETASPKHDDYILIHDAARCFVTVDIIHSAVRAAREFQAISVGIPSSDSLKEVHSDGKVVRTLDRDTVWRVQTPQIFRYDLITRAHGEGFRGATDDASLVERIHPVHMVMGSEANKKITTPYDLIT